MDVVIKLIVASLATYRLAELIALDSGPWFAFKRFRGLTKKLSVQYGLFFTSFAEGITCPYCVGVWMAGLTVLLTFGLSLSLTQFTLYTLAVAGLQSVIQHKVEVS